MNPDGWGGEIPLSQQGASQADFTIRDIRVGEVVDARTFLVADDGTLMGVVLKRHWQPGINAAECWRPTSWLVEGVGRSTTAPREKRDRIPTGNMTVVSGVEMPEHHWVSAGWSWTVDGVEGYSPEKPTPVFGNNDRAHDIAKCSCGLHGYLSGSLDYSYRPESVNGIVKASGTVWMGSRGFRASHARVAALYVPTIRTPLRDLPPRPDRDSTLEQGFRYAGVGGLVTEEVIDLVRERYDIPIYHDLGRMLADFPTEPPPPKPKAITDGSS